MVDLRLLESGAEPPLAAETRTGLFSIAHNALTNACRPAGAGRVEVKRGVAWARLERRLGELLSSNISARVPK